ncbi:MAG: ABC transporter permease [Gemmatimonadales bacterium]
METLRRFWRGLVALTRRRADDAELSEEIQHYLDEATEAHLADGLDPAEARRAARLELGSAAAVRDEVKSSGWEHQLETLFGDLRYAVRVLRATPTFTLVAILIVALGIGAVTTTFSAMNAIVLRHLPGAADPERLVQVDRRHPSNDEGIQSSYESYDFLRRETSSLTGLAAWSKATFVLARAGEGVAVYGNLASGNYFSVLGVRPFLGSLFTSEDDRTPLGHPVLVVSHAFWTNRLGADSSVVGSSVVVNGAPYTLIGVAAPGFHGVFTPLRVDAWIPLAMQQQLRPGRDLEHQVWLWTFGRLAPETTREAARAELEIQLARYIAEGSEPASRAAYSAIRLIPMNGLPADAHAMAIGFIGLLLGASALVLLIASVNLASMLSARALARRREMAVRAALGAGRGRLVRQLLSEVLLLFLIGSVGGALLAVEATALLERIPIPGDVPLVLEISPDARVFGFAVLLSVVTGLVFGLAPALRASKVDLAARLRDGAQGAGARRSLGSQALIVSQLALSLVLLVAAGLFLRAFDRGRKTDPGFDATGVATAMFNTESWGYDRARGQAFYEELRRRIEGLPGVTAVSFTNSTPLAFATSGGQIQLEGDRADQSERNTGHPIQLTLVGPDYFTAIAMPLASGRPILPTDVEGAPRVAVVNETFASRFWPDGSALGRTFRYLGDEVTIVGVARDAKYGSLGEVTPAFAFFAIAQRWIPNQVMLVRSTGSFEALRPLISDETLAIDPLLPRPTVITLAEANAVVVLPQRIAAIVTGVLGAVGLLLATAGLYGVIAYSVGRRTREIGVRVALGAARGDLLRLVLQEGMRLALVGTLIGVALALAAGRLLGSLLLSVSPSDLLTFAVTVSLLVLTTLLASYLPARRAARADPMSALRLD